MLFRKYISCVFLLTLSCLIFIFALSSCNKQEQVWAFNITPQDTVPPPATNKDTVISVTAVLNNDSFKALGRAEPPAGKLDISFLDLGSDASLIIALGADTVGSYLLGRSISANTAVWYTDDGKSYTSRATEDAGGLITITEVDTVKHRIKGSFDLLLLSRTDSSQYDFQEGQFDILYNHISFLMDETAFEVEPTETIKANALSAGSATDPQPDFALQLNDSLILNMTIVSYEGTGIYDASDTNKVKVQLLDTKNAKVYTAFAGEIDLIRFNYGEFIQLLFSCDLKADDDKQISLTSGSIVIGN